LGRHSINHAMANTYSQISVHSVFAVRGRENFITRNWRDDLHKYISGIITGNGARSLAVGGWKDHVHIFFGMPVTTCISDFMSIVKASSSKWINEKRFVKGKFQWSRLWRFFLFEEPKRSCHKLRYESGRTPQDQNI
jgi:putative transposase